MKTKTKWAIIALFGGLLTINAQIQTSTLTSFGNSAGTFGSYNAFYGFQAGNAATSSAYYNTLIGHASGKLITSGDYNTTLGYLSASNLTTGGSNTIIGAYTEGPTTGRENVMLGYSAKISATDSHNTYLGAHSGTDSSGSNNVFIGYGAGFRIKQDNILVIDNESNSADYFIWGDFANKLLKFSSKVGIGITTFPTVAGGVDLSKYKLFVQGGILAEEVRVTTTWADYVFEDNYELPSLEEVECYVEENGHLPNVPSAKQVAEEGISVGEMAKIQQEKIEELTLYIIAQDKQLKEQQIKIENLEKQEQELNKLKILVQALIDKK